MRRCIEAKKTGGVIDDLFGKTIHVRKSSSYYESLLSLNERIKKEDGGIWSKKRKPPVKIITVTC